VDLDGHVVWRQGLTEAGDLTTPVVVGKTLVFSGSRAGLFIVDRETGDLLELFNPGRASARPDDRSRHAPHLRPVEQRNPLRPRSRVDLTGDGSLPLASPGPPRFAREAALRSPVSESRSLARLGAC